MDTLLCLLCLFALSLWLGAQLRMHMAVAPLIALSFAVVWLMVWGVAGALLVGGWLLYLLGAAALGWVLWKRRAGLRGLLCEPGLWLFFGGALLLMALLATKQPLLYRYDEYTFWGTAAKLLARDNSLYTTADIGWWWTQTQSPALPLLSWFAQFFGRGFVEWKMYWGIDLIHLGCGAALLALVPRREWQLWVPVGVIGLLLPFMAGVQNRLIFLNTTYVTSYGDLPAGFLLGGALCVYIAARKLGANALLWAALPLAASALVKDNVFPIVLVGAGLVFVDSLFFAPGKARGRLGAAVGLAAIPLAAYLVWSFHGTWANSLNPVTGGDETGVSQGEAIVSVTRQLLGLETYTDRLRYALADMSHAVLDSTDWPVTMFGSVVRTGLLILAFFALAALLVPGKRQKLRLGLAAVLSVLGCLGYQFVLLVSYGKILKVEGVYDYDRYEGSYFAFWLLLGLAVLVAVVALRLERAPEREKVLYHSGSLVAGVCSLALVGSMVPAGYSFLDASPRYYDDSRALLAQGEVILEAVGEDGRVFFVDQEGDGENWFRYSYAILPAFLDYSIGGGSYFGPEVEYDPVPLARLEGYLEENRCGFVYIESLDDSFVEAYAGLFTDGLAAAREGTARLYARGADGLYSPEFGVTE